MVDSNFDPRSLVAESRIGVLATIKANGLPQLSPVTGVYDRDADTIYVSITEGRALIGPGTDPDGPEVDTLVDYYRRSAGEHPDWQEYRAVMVSDRRVLMALRITRVYGAKLR